MVIESDSAWRVDKTIPLASIGAVLVEAALIVIILTTLNNDVNSLKINYDKLEKRMITQEESRVSAERQLVRLEEQIKTSNDLLQKIWVKIERTN